MLALAACDSGSREDASDAGASPSDDASGGASLVVGTGEKTFVALDDVAGVPLSEGPQGGYHVWIALLARELGPRVAVAYGLRDASSGERWRSRGFAARARPCGRLRSASSPGCAVPRSSRPMPTWDGRSRCGRSSPTTRPASPPRTKAKPSCSIPSSKSSACAASSAGSRPARAARAGRAHRLRDPRLCALRAVRHPVRPQYRSRKWVTRSGAEPHRWQGARPKRTCRYGEGAQRSQRGWIDAPTGTNLRGRYSGWRASAA